MKWDVRYLRATTGTEIWYSADTELNPFGSIVEADSAEAAIDQVKNEIAELMYCNALGVEKEPSGILVYEVSDHDFIERYYAFTAQRIYVLVNASNNRYYSHTPGTFGGHKRLKIYGRLDCPSALRYIAKGQYVQHRVFFADEQTAIDAGYRPCGVCMKTKYNEWKAKQTRN